MLTRTNISEGTMQTSQLPTATLRPTQSRNTKERSNRRQRHIFGRLRDCRMSYNDLQHRRRYLFFKWRKLLVTCKKTSITGLPKTHGIQFHHSWLFCKPGFSQMPTVMFPGIGQTLGDPRGCPLLNHTQCELLEPKAYNRVPVGPLAPENARPFTLPPVH